MVGSATLMIHRRGHHENGRAQGARSPRWWSATPRMAAPPAIDAAIIHPNHLRHPGVCINPKNEISVAQKNTPTPVHVHRQPAACAASDGTEAERSIGQSPAWSGYRATTTKRMTPPAKAAAAKANIGMAIQAETVCRVGGSLTGVGMLRSGHGRGRRHTVSVCAGCTAPRVLQMTASHHRTLDRPVGRARVGGSEHSRMINVAPACRSIHP